jgi:peptide/nickel transport system permease protein
MGKYLLKRVLIFLPTLLLISLLVFALSKASPGDPVSRILMERDDLETDDQAYQKIAAQLGLDKPAFYVSLSSRAFPDTLHQIIRKSHRDNLTQLIHRHGNWPQIKQYYYKLLGLRHLIQNLPDELRNDDYLDIRRIVSQLFVQYSDEEINRLIQSLSEVRQRPGFALGEDVANSIQITSDAYDTVLAQKSIWQLYVPTLHWQGFDNQYHHWMSGFFQGDFGISYRDSRPVSRKIGEALWWTLLMSLSSLIIIFSVSIPLGIYMAGRKGSITDRYLSLLLFGFYSLPRFWVATLLLVFFTTAEYGSWLDIFPGPGLGELRSTAPFWGRFVERGSHLLLPVFCLSYAGIAYVTRQIRGNMLDVLDQDFVRTARAKGLDERTVLWRHAFRNALFPLITLAAMTIPGLLAGSVIVEFIFAIPGMGRLMLSSILEQDWPFVYTVLLLTALLTMVSNLVGDICYGWADPRVKF